MTELHRRKPPLKRVYIRCPKCGRVLKARARQVNKLAHYHFYPYSEPPTLWRIECIPKHRTTYRGPERLTTLLLTGEDKTRPWCEYRYIRTDEGDFVTEKGPFEIIGDRHRKPRGKKPKSP